MYAFRAKFALFVRDLQNQLTKIPGGERGIRTPEATYVAHTLSKRALSTAQPSLRYLKTARKILYHKYNVDIL